MTGTRMARSRLLVASRPATPVWASALLVAVALHAGCLTFAMTRAPSEDVADALGAPAMEIGLDLVAPHQDQTDLPPGPEAEASAASSAAVEQKAKVEQTDLPKEQPTETPDPDRLVAPDASKPRKDDSPKVMETRANAAAESVASEAAAPPSIPDAIEAARSTAPAQGTGESARLVKTTWQKELVAHLNRFKRYPTNSTRRGAEIMVTFTLDRFGHVLSSNIQRGSGDAGFDHAVIAMLKLADPVPPPPPLVADEGLTFSLPVIFRDRRK